MRKCKIAAILMIIHGGFMEICGCLMVPPILIFGGSSNTNQYVSFIVPYFQRQKNN
jgi:hypothetical protein